MKILRAYAVTAIICMSITAITACIFIADENTRKISFGSESAVAVMSASSETVAQNAVNLTPLIEKIKDITEKTAGFAPPPINNIYWFAVNSKIDLN